MSIDLGSVALVAADRASSLATLKRAALLFERIVVATRFTPRDAEGRRWSFAAPRRVRAELDWLAEHGVLLDSGSEPSEFRAAQAGKESDINKWLPHGFWYAAIPQIMYASANASLVVRHAWSE